MGPSSSQKSSESRELVTITGLPPVSRPLLPSLLEAHLPLFFSIASFRGAQRGSLTRIWRLEEEDLILPSAAAGRVGKVRTGNHLVRAAEARAGAPPPPRQA